MNISIKFDQYLLADYFFLFENYACKILRETQKIFSLPIPGREKIKTIYFDSVTEQSTHKRQPKFFFLCFIAILAIIIIR